MDEVVDGQHGDPSNASSAEIVSALEKMFPELDPHEVLAWFRRITEEQHLRLRLLYN